MEDYAFTVKVLGNENLKAVPSDYEKVWSHWEKSGCQIKFKNAEDDSRGVLHYHGILSIPTGFYRKKLSVPGVHNKFEHLYDRKGWLRYCVKNQIRERTIPKPKKVVKCLFKVEFN